MFLFEKIFTKTPSDRVERRKGLCFKLFHSSTSQRGMVDTLNPVAHV
jgi:hypothetical protein